MRIFEEVDILVIMKCHFILRFKKSFINIVVVLLISFGSSFAAEEYYLNIGSNLELKIIAKKNKNFFTEEIQTIDGEIMIVEKEAIINSSDIRGISLNSDEIRIYFNRNSWEKIRVISSSLHGSKIALIKNNKIIFSPTMVSTIDKSTTLPFPINVDIDWFLKGFLRRNSNQVIYSNDVYIQYLKKWHSTHQDDVTVLRTLTSYIMPNNDFSNCEEVIHYYKQILKNTPNDFEIGNKLITCLLYTHKNEQALEIANILYKNVNDNIMRNHIILLLGEIYYRLGMLKESLQQTEIALIFYKKLEIPDLSDWEDMPALREKQKNSYMNVKEESILFLEKRVKSLKKELEMRSVKKED